MNIRISIASDEETLKAYAQSYVTWGGDFSFEEYCHLAKEQQEQLQSKLWVLYFNNTLVGSMGMHALTFFHKGIEASGFGLAALHTEPEYRRLGLGQKMLEHVIGYAQQNLGQMGLIYSAIPPQYYQKMGFQSCAHFRHVCNDLLSLAQSAPVANIKTIDPVEHLLTIKRLYDAHHQQSPFALARDLEYWKYSLKMNSLDTFWGIFEQETVVGYLRVYGREHYCILVEYIHPRATDETQARSFSALTTQIMMEGRSLLSTWLEIPQPIQHLFSRVQRPNMIPMLYGTGEPDEVTAQSPIYSSDYF